MTAPVVRVEDLTVRLGAVTALDGLSLAIPAGGITALLGPNGAGKTTLVGVLTGLRRPSAGTATVLGRDPEDPAVKPLIGVMPQDGGLSPTARPLEWLRYLARLYPDPADPRALLERVGLDPASRTPARRMSGGEQQRLKLAAALLPQPRLLILDEPTAGLDPQARRALIEDLRAMAEEGTSILLTTHLLADVEELADHVVIVARGRRVAEGSVAELTATATATADTITIRSDGPLDGVRWADALPAGSRVHVPGPGIVTVHGPTTPEAIAAIAAALATAGVLATSITVGRRTLEDLVIEAGSP